MEPRPLIQSAGLAAVGICLGVAIIAASHLAIAGVVQFMAAFGFC